MLTVCFTIPSEKNSIQTKSFQFPGDLLSKKEGSWYYFNKGHKIPVGELIEKEYKLFDLPQGISSSVEKEDTDEFGMKHYQLKLTIQGIPIEDAYYTAHYSKEGDLLHVVGTYNKNEIPKEGLFSNISAQKAFELAKNEFITSQNVNQPDLLKLVNEELSDFYRKGEINPVLVFYRPDDKSKLGLCYKVEFFSKELERFNTFYIDAFSGNVVKVIDHRAFNLATVQTRYNGSKTVQVKWRGWPYSYYYLRHEAFSTPIETRNSTIRYGYPNCTPWGFDNLGLAYKGDLNWPIDYKYNAASSHWAVQESYNVFRNTYGRTYGTFATSGGEIRMENNFTSFYNYNASPFYQAGGSYDYIHVGQTIGTSGYEGSLDVIAHEFTHGVMYRARGVDGYAYQYNETGALCESFADIFAIMVEYFTLGTTDYIVGSNVIDNFKRSIQNPTTYQSYSASVYNDINCMTQISNLTGYTVPLYYQQNPYWINGTGSLPAHVNNSVQNYWFYLLANGGSQLGVSVSGISLNSASRIAYRNMAYYLSLGSTFDDMRQASIVSASVLYGECSNEYTQVINAWAAVGVGAAATPCIHTEIIGPESLMCGEPGYFFANTQGGSGNYSYSWYVDNTFYSSSSSINLGFYPQYQGEYHYINLQVTDGSVSGTDDENLFVYGCGDQALPTLKEDLKFKIYPNPATSSTKVEIDDDPAQVLTQYSIQILDRNGRIIYSGKSYEKEFIINTSSFQKGVYNTIIKTGKKLGSTNLIVE